MGEVFYVKDNQTINGFCPETSTKYFGCCGLTHDFQTQLSDGDSYAYWEPNVVPSTGIWITIWQLCLIWDMGDAINMLSSDGSLIMALNSFVRKERLITLNTCRLLQILKVYFSKNVGLLADNIIFK